MTDDGLTPTQRAFLSAQYHREAFTDLSAADINRLDMATYARMTGRQTPVQAAIEAADPEPSGRPRQAPQTAPATPAAPDFRAMDLAAYSAIRSRYIKRPAGDGVGLFGNDN